MAEAKHLSSSAALLIDTFIRLCTILIECLGDNHSLAQISLFACILSVGNNCNKSSLFKKNSLFFLLSSLMTVALSGFSADLIFMCLKINLLKQYGLCSHYNIVRFDIQNSLCCHSIKKITTMQ